MNAFDYLKTLPVLYINVDGHTERHQAFIRHTAPLFHTIHRIPAVPVTNIVAAANAFVRKIQSTRQHPHMRTLLQSAPRLYSTTGFLTPTDLAHTYAYTRSLTLSTKNALQHALDLGYERFMIMDDDARPRHQLLEELGVPPDADIRIWGGGYDQPHGITKDSRDFLHGITPQWRRIHGGQLYSHAYELNQSGAQAMLQAIEECFHSIDITWWHAFQHVTACALAPSAFTQVGASVRTQSRGHHGTVQRGEPSTAQ